MYSRDFGGIKSDGNLQEMRDAFRDETPPLPENLPDKEHPGRLSEILKGIELDDLIIIALGVLLLLDSDASDDHIILLIILMLLF